MVKRRGVRDWLGGIGAVLVGGLETAQSSQICFGYPGIFHQSSLKPDPQISVAVHRDDHLASLAGQGVVATSDSIYDPPSRFQDS